MEREKRSNTSGVMGVEKATLSAKWKEGEREWGNGCGKRDPVAHGNKEMIEIVEILQKYVPTDKAVKRVHSVAFGGDQLTVERCREIQQARSWKCRIKSWYR